MQLSKYNLFVSDFPNPGESVIFHSRTQAMVKIEEKLKNILQKLPFLTDEEIDYFNQFIKPLEEMGIVVLNEQEEKHKLKAFFKELAQSPNSVPFEATILTTYKCNFACPYCFEKEAEDKSDMHQETTLKVIEWLKNRAKKRGYANMVLVFYGGEPLLNAAPIKAIAGEMKAWCSREGIGFYFTIVTNGSFLTGSLIEELNPLGLESVRVTLDGTEEIHNKRRPQKEGAGSFGLIIDNLKQITGRTKVIITANYDEENYDSLFHLLNYLDEAKLLKKINQCIFAPVVPRLGPQGQPRRIGLSHCLSFFGENGMYDKGLALNSELKKRGFELKNGLGINACSLIMEDGGVVIDPNGILYKCPSLLGHKEFAAGSVNEEKFNHVHHHFMNLKVWEQCPRDCPYLPLCGGGCRLFSYFENGNFKKACCKRGLLDRLAPELIKMDYARKQYKATPNRQQKEVSVPA